MGSEPLPNHSVLARIWFSVSRSCIDYSSEWFSFTLWSVLTLPFDAQVAEEIETLSLALLSANSFKSPRSSGPQGTPMRLRRRQEHCSAACPSWVLLLLPVPTQAGGGCHGPSLGHAESSGFLGQPRLHFSQLWRSCPLWVLSRNSWQMGLCEPMELFQVPSPRAECILAVQLQSGAA